MRDILNSTIVNTVVGFVNTVVSATPIVQEVIRVEEGQSWLSSVTPKQWTLSSLCLTLAMFFFWRAWRGYKQPEPLPEDDTGEYVDILRLPMPITPLLGRATELGQLTEAMTNPDRLMAAIIAGGGVGKSALTSAWKDEIQPDYKGAKRVLAWSFYSQGSHETANSSAPFFEAALPFFGHEGEMPKDEVEKGRALAERLLHQPFLLILDGMEPLQHPPHIQGGEIADSALKELLRCVRLYGFEKNGAKSLILISSRQPVRELEPWEKEKYLSIDLNLLNKEEGASLLESLNVKGTREQLEAASRDMGGHALGLVLLGKLLDERFDGDVRCRDQIKDLRGFKNLAGLFRYYETYWQEPAFMKRFYGWLRGREAPERIFLRLMGLFDRPLGMAEKNILLVKSDYAAPLAQFNDKEFADLEKRLENTGLLLKQGSAEILFRREWDCHPIIRNYFGQTFQKEEPKAYQQAQRVLFEYYQSVPNKEQPDTLQELEPLYRAVVHGCLAGEYQKTLDDVYFERICRGKEAYSTHKLGAYAHDLTAISAFSPGGWEKPVSSGLSQADQAWLLAQASFCLMSLGRLAEAVGPRWADMKISEKLEDWKGAAVTARNLTDLLLPIGQLREAENAARRAIDFADRTDDLFSQMSSRAKLATTLHRQGGLQEAFRHFEEAEKIQQEEQPKYPRLYSLQGALYCALLSDQAGDAERDLLGARLAKTSEVLKTSEVCLEPAEHYLQNALETIERIGYLGLMDEWKEIRN